MRNFNFVVCFRWSDKRSFSIFVNGKKQIVRRTAGLSLVSLGWERKEKLKFGRSQATRDYMELIPNNLYIWRIM